MIFSALALASATSSAMASREAYDAIFSDVFLNAWIGNGNLEVSLDWAYGVGAEFAPELKIERLQCQKHWRLETCRFDLTRTANAAAGETDRALHSRLSCKANFHLRDNGEAGWKVVHLRPRRGGGHSRTTMTCRKSVSEGAAPGGGNQVGVPRN
jgi:hypothetical protein